MGYTFLQNSAFYEWDIHNHGTSDFRYGVNSTSHIEALLHGIKAKFTNTYATFPNINFFFFYVK